jgi:hypothetical protein
VRITFWSFVMASFNPVLCLEPGWRRQSPALCAQHLAFGKMRKRTTGQCRATACLASYSAFAMSAGGEALNPSSTRAASAPANKLCASV